MKIKFVEIKDILSIGEARIEFKDSGLTLLDGWNHDDNTANGAGKSSIPNAISFGLYDNMPRKVSKSEFLRRGAKQGFVHVGIEVPEGLLEVKRYRPKNVEFYLNGSILDITQEDFENRIKLSYNQFLLCAYAAQVEGSRFVSLNDTDKKSFILRLMDLERFSDKKKAIDAQIKDLSNTRLEIEKTINTCSSKISVYEEQIVDRNEIEAQIRSIDLNHLNEQLLKYSSIEKPDYSELDTIRQKVNVKLQKLNDVEGENAVARRLYGNLEKEIKALKQFKPSNSIECPHCLKAFYHEGGKNQTVDQIMAKHAEELKDKEEQLKKLVNAINSTSDTQSKRAELISIRRKVEDKIDAQEERYRESISVASDIRSKIKIQQAKIDSLNEQLSSQGAIAQKISDLKLIKDKANNKLNKVNSELEILATLAHILSPTGAPAYVVDSVVDMFNERVASYVSLVWPNATYELQAFKENKSGDIKAKFSDRLFISGKAVSIGSLSGGEFRCLSLAVDFAIVDVVENLFGFQISPLFLDEPFEGLDVVNREKVIDLLDKLSVSRQVWIIDHASEAKSMFSDVLRIEKQNGISRIV